MYVYHTHKYVYTYAIYFWRLLYIGGHESSLIKNQK